MASTRVRIDKADVTEYVVEGTLKRAAHDLGGHTRMVQFRVRPTPTNQLPNSSFVDGANGWARYDNALEATDSIVAGRTDGSAWRTTWAGTSTNTKGVLRSAAVPTPPVWKPLATYVVSFYARMLAAPSIAGGMILAWNVPPAVVTALLNPNLTTAFQRYAFRITWGASVEFSGGVAGLYISIQQYVGMLANSVEIEDVMREEGTDLHDFVGGKDDNTAPAPANDSYVEVTRTDGVTPDFRGLARMPDDARTPLRGVEYDVTAIGWESLLDTVLITATFTQLANRSDVEALTSLLALYWGQIGASVTHYMYSARSDLPEVSILAGSTTLRSFLDELAHECGAVAWWIDPLKGLHWNDLEQAAPWVLSDAPNGSTKRGFSEIVRHRESIGRRVRVRVVGSGVEYTATDWEAWVTLNARRAGEAGIPAERFPQLTDVIDLTITTTEQAKRLAFQLLAAEAARQTLIVKAVDSEGLEIGQRIDVMDSSRGNETAPHPGLEQWELGVTSTTADLDGGLGRFLVTKVTPIPKGTDDWRWDVELGDPELILAAQMSRGNL